MSKKQEKNDAPPKGDEPKAKPPVKIVPSSEKIGEDRTNLRRRQEWFERRSGKQ